MIRCNRFVTFAATMIFGILSFVRTRRPLTTHTRPPAALAVALLLTVAIHAQIPPGATIHGYRALASPGYNFPVLYPSIDQYRDGATMFEVIHAMRTIVDGDTMSSEGMGGTRYTYDRVEGGCLVFTYVEAWLRIVPDTVSPVLLCNAIQQSSRTKSARKVAPTARSYRPSDQPYVFTKRIPYFDGNGVLNMRMVYGRDNGEGIKERYAEVDSVGYADYSLYRIEDDRWYFCYSRSRNVPEPPDSIVIGNVNRRKKYEPQPTSR